MNFGQRTIAYSAAILVTLIGAAVINLDYTGDSYTVMGVMLGEPPNTTIYNESTLTFTYYPVISNGTFYKCELWTNETGSWALEETNTSEILNASMNSFTHTLT